LLRVSYLFFASLSLVTFESSNAYVSGVYEPRKNTVLSIALRVSDVANTRVNYLVSPVHYAPICDVAGLCIQLQSGFTLGAPSAFSIPYLYPFYTSNTLLFNYVGASPAGELAIEDIYGNNYLMPIEYIGAIPARFTSFTSIRINMLDYSSARTCFGGYIQLAVSTSESISI